MEQVLFESVANTPELTLKHIQYILVLVKEVEPYQTQETIREVVGVIQKHDIDIESMTGALITAIVWNSYSEKPPKTQRMELVSELEENFNADISVIHGECECPVGNIGNERRMCHTAMLPDYKQKINRLSSLNYGDVEEIKS